MSRAAVVVAAVLIVACAAQAQVPLVNFEPAANPNSALIDGGDGFLYGMTTAGGAYGRGQIYRIASGTSMTTVASLNEYTGMYPYGALLRIGSTLYGTTSSGGPNQYGTVFKFNIITAALEVIASFSAATGAGPHAGLIAYNGILYGTTSHFGPSGHGSVFSVDPATGALTVMTGFASTADGYYPEAPLVAKNGMLYGTTQYGGANSLGTVFKIDPASGVLTTLSSLVGIGILPTSGLIDGGTFLYGTTSSGGANSAGAVFKVDPVSGTVSPVIALPLSLAGPVAGVVTDGAFLYGASYRGGTNSCGAIFKADFAGTTVTTVASFNTTNGSSPRTDLSLIGSTIYGTTASGGANGSGTVFKIAVGGSTIVTMDSFPVSAAATPYSKPLLSGGFLYGTTTAGGANGVGTIFKTEIATGVTTTIASFNTTMGFGARGGMVLKGGFLYGVTQYGGAYNFGAIFRVDPNDGSTLTAVASFNGINGRSPYASLVEYNSFLYGTTTGGGVASDGGTVFKFDPSTNTLTTLASFTGTNGAAPYSELVVSGSYLYGTTFSGGAYNEGTIYRIDSLTGTLTTLTSFGYGMYSLGGLCAVGSVLYGIGRSGTLYKYDLTTSTFTIIGPANAGTLMRSALIIIGSDLYAEASSGGAYGRGTIFRFDPVTNAVVVIAGFDGANGSEPDGGLATDGTTLYGTTVSGGSKDGGVVFALPIIRQTTTTNLTSSANPSNFGAQVTFTATVAPAGTGLVTFFDGNTSIGVVPVANGQAAFTTTALVPGSRNIKASYHGNSSYAGSTSTTLVQTVNGAGVFTYTDDPLTARATLVKAVHITELRSAIDTVRDATGLPGYAWRGSIVQGGVVQGATIAEMRQALSEALARVGRTLTFAAPVGAGAPIRATNIQELRNYTK